MDSRLRKKCEICIGCGRCNADLEGLHVLTTSFLKTELLSGEKSLGKGSFVLVDLGTTTIAMEAYSEAGKKSAEYVCPNPQRIYGADVISRIEAAENDLQAKHMRSLVQETLLVGLHYFAEIGLKIKQLYIAGNTTMLNLLCGHDVKPLGYAPFCAEHLNSETMMLGQVPAVTLPGLSAFVGGDIVAGILACGMHKREEITLLIDLGTNGEMVLGNKDKLLACSTAAGPAFEGMLKVQGKAAWGADIVEYVAALLNNRVIDETGLLRESYFDRGVTVGGVLITQEHIRSLQVAKAAVAAGIQALLEQYQLQAEDVDKVYLAGGFGYYLKEEAALRIGLLPEAFRGKIQAVGNSALAGCYVYHFGTNMEQEGAYIRAITEIVELPEVQGFGDDFIENMNFSI